MVLGLQYPDKWLGSELLSLLEKERPRTPALIPASANGMLPTPGQTVRVVSGN